MNYVYAEVNDQEEARLFFDEYNIPYQIPTRGTRAGELKVGKIRDKDSRMAVDVVNLFQAFGYGELCDHIRIFRDSDDETVVTMSPYYLDSVETIRAENGEFISEIMKVKIPEYDVEISDYSIYGLDTKTVVVRKRYFL